MGRSKAERAIAADVKANAALKSNAQALIDAAVKAAGPRELSTVTAEARANRQANNAKAEVKALSHRVIELEAEVAFMHAAPAHPPTIHTPSARPKTGKRIATPAFLWSDWHFGERVTLAESLGLNQYDLAEAAKRAAKCIDNSLWLRKDMSRTQSCDDTFLAINGDMVSGDIHDELRETNDGGLRDQCNACVAALIPGVAAMADATPGVLHVVCIGGNHGRLTHKQHIKNGTQHSAEHLGVYDPLRRYFDTHPKYRGGKIAWHIPQAERHITDVHGFRVSTQHGTMIKSQGGIGGTLVPMTRWVTRANDADVYLFGHFHAADAYGKVIKNGALIGASGYTSWLGIDGTRPPEQVAFVLDADRGVRRFERVSVT
jgi:predicted phosphodiesterase